MLQQTSDLAESESVSSVTSEHRNGDRSGSHVCHGLTEGRKGALNRKVPETDESKWNTAIIPFTSHSDINSEETNNEKDGDSAVIDSSSSW